MIRPDYRLFLHSSRVLTHSAKGTTWDEHKYIKRIDGTYYYPNNYEGGRHLPKDDNDSSNDQVKIPEEKKKPRNPELELEDWEKTLYDKLFDISKNSDTAAEFRNFREMVKEFADEDFLKRLSYTREKDKEISDDLEKERAEAEEAGYDPDTVKRKTISERGDENALSTKDLTRYENFKKQVAELCGKNGEVSDDEMETMLKKIKFHYEDIAKATSLDEKDVESLANEVIDGHFGDDTSQKELLGSNYSKIKSRVNAILKEREAIEKAKKAAEEAAKKASQKASATRTSRTTSYSKKTPSGSSEPAVKSSSSSSSKSTSTKKKTQAEKGLNMNKVFNVYRKRR